MTRSADLAAYEASLRPLRLRELEAEAERVLLGAARSWGRLKDGYTDRAVECLRELKRRHLAGLWPLIVGRVRERRAREQGIGLPLPWEGKADG